MEAHGYIFTKDGALALGLGSSESSAWRYAASLDDGSGIVAFDGDMVAINIPDMRVRFATENWDPKWPSRPAPKRYVSNGQERFALMTQARFSNIVVDPLTVEHITGAVVLDDESVLVETDGFVLIADWTAGAAEVRDRRLVDA